MGSSTPFLEMIAAEPDAGSGMTFARFMDLALYHPALGYYRGARKRVGREGADFYTSTSVGPVFGELVAAAAEKLIQPRPTADFEFVEIGAERGAGALGESATVFRSSRTLSLGERFTLTGDTVAFSNELFDAQPCHRIVWRGGAWRETGVAIREGALVEVELPGLSAEVAAIRDRLPGEAPEGYRIDLPIRSASLLREIAREGWSGLFIAFDYGKTWRQLAEDTPQGTVRGYSRHRQTADLLAEPGEQDLTCHVCWDWLEAELAAAGFTGVAVESQEAFFARHAGRAAEDIISAQAGRFSSRKQALLQLMHPGQMGHKFQVLSALRQ